MDSMTATIAFLALIFSGDARATPSPYDEAADARLEIRQAVSEAKSSRRLVLVVFGANWCEDCRALNRALHAPANAPLLSKDFVVVKVDVGKFDRNTDVAQSLGVPLKKGIPAAAVMSAESQVLYATSGGELSNARRMSGAGIVELLRTVAARNASARL